MLTTIALLAGTLLVGPDPVPLDTTLTLGPRPALVAFFGLPREALMQDPMLTQVFEDFRASIGSAKPGVEQVEMDVHIIYDQTITLTAGGQEKSLPVRDGLPIGYYFWSPAGPAYVCRGVRVDFDIVNEAKNYLEALRTGVYETLYRCEQVP